MDYKIIDNPKYTNRYKIGIQTIPENETLYFFLSGLSLVELPNHILRCTKSKGFRTENSSIQFFSEMDWEDIANLDLIGGIKEGEVCIYLYDGKSNYSVLEEKVFDRIFYDYSKKILVTYLGTNEVLGDWAIRMEKGIKELEEKIGSKQ